MTAPHELSESAARGIAEREASALKELRLFAVAACVNGPECAGCQEGDRRIDWYTRVVRENERMRVDAEWRAREAKDAQRLDALLVRGVCTYNGVRVRTVEELDAALAARVGAA